MSKKAFDKIAAGLTDALKIALGPRREHEFAAAISKFWNQDGSVERGREIYDALAKRMPGEGQMPRASDGHDDHADARQQVEGEEAGRSLPQGHSRNASSPSSNRGGEGHTEDARTMSQTNSALPVREPSASYLKTLGEERKAIARSVLYEVRTSDGKWWGDIHPYEVSGMARDHIRGTALMSALGPLNSRQMKMTFGELFKPHSEQAKIAMDKADEELRNV